MAEAPYRGLDSGVARTTILALKTCWWPKKSEDTTRHRARPCRRHRTVGDRLPRRPASQRAAEGLRRQASRAGQPAVGPQSTRMSWSAPRWQGTRPSWLAAQGGGLATAQAPRPGHCPRPSRDSCVAVFGLHKVNLQTRATNSEVRGFYEALGFEVEERLSMARHIATHA